MRLIPSSPLARRLAVAAGIAVLVVAPALTAADLIKQPAGRHSSLVTGPGGSIVDTTFANMVKDLLIGDQGKSRAKDAKFFFQTCFGGGMLDDIEKALGDKVPWVGGSASAWNQTAFGEPANKKDRDPSGFWTAELLKQWERALEKKKDINLLDSIDKANKRDKAPETGQSIAKNGGEKITLQDPGAKSHHAVIWAGRVDMKSIKDDVQDLRRTLNTAWKGTKHSVTVLAGNGNVFKNSEAATRKNLKKVFDDLKTKLGPDEQFLFFAHDHGDFDNVDRGAFVPGMGKDVQTVSLDPGQLEGLLNEPNPTPTFRVNHTGVSGPTSVFFNDLLLGSLDPTRNNTTFAVPESIVSLSNEVEIENHSSSPFTIRSKRFASGPISLVTFHAVPEPGGFVLAGLGIACMLTAVARRHVRAATLG